MLRDSRRTEVDSKPAPRCCQRYICVAYIYDAVILSDNFRFRFLLKTVDIGLPANKADSVTMTCQLTDSSEVTHYEWVHRDAGNQSVTSIHPGKELTVDQRSGENQGEWTCLFYGTQGVLGNVTHHLTMMSTLLFVITWFSVQKR